MGNQEKQKAANRGSVKVVILLVLLLAVIIAAYFLVLWYKQKEADNLVTAQETEAERLLAKDIEGSYPKTAREVLKLYCQLTKCLYSGEISTEEMYGLGDQMRLLFDEELLESNTREQQQNDLLAEVSAYRTEGKVISSYTIEQVANFITWTYEGKEYVSAVVLFTVLQNKGYARVYEEFLLRQDESGRYRILGWQLADEADMD